MKKLENLNSDFEYELLGENQQVADLRNQLEDLYSSPFTDILLWELYDPSLTKNGYYKLFYYEQSVLKHIILFKYTTEVPKKIAVLNKEFKISTKDIENIGKILFHEFKKVRQIIFENIFEPDTKQMPKMVFKNTSNDVIIKDLPKTADDYMKSLSKKTRHKIRLMINRITTDFPDYQINFVENNDIIFDQIQRIVQMNQNRMETKGIKSDLNDIECNVLHQYTSTSGFGCLCLSTIDGKIAGATINSIIVEHAYSHVMAHDSSYNQYSIGQVTMFNTTKYLIEEKNIKYHHMLCGTQEYKFRHGGANHDQFTFWVFRNSDIFYFCKKTMFAFRDKLRNNKIVYKLYHNIIKKGV